MAFASALETGQVQVCASLLRLPFFESNKSKELVTLISYAALSNVEMLDVTDVAKRWEN